MKEYMQKMGRSLMLPVATLPVAALFTGIGYWIDPTGWGANNVLAAFMIQAGQTILNNLGLLFAVVQGQRRLRSSGWGSVFPCAYDFTQS